MLSLVHGVLGAEWLYAPPGSDVADSYTQVTSWANWPDCVVGREQSPINVVSAHAAVAPRTLDDSIDLNWPRRTVIPKNNKHAFQLHETSPEHFQLKGKGDKQVESGLFKGTSILRKERYNFYQVHFHAPSENTIDGKSFAMEAHFVHQLADEEFMARASVKTEWPNKVDGQGTLVGTLQHLAVISVMFELGPTCNSNLDEFWDLFPADASKTEYADKEVPVDLSAFIQPILWGGYYHWDGSLTTPPCTEGVDWNLLKMPLPICERQVETLKAALARTQKGVRVNNRVTQPLNDRLVTQTSSGTIWRPLSLLTFALSVVSVGLSFAILIMCRKLQKVNKVGASPIISRKKVIQIGDATPAKTSTTAGGDATEMSAANVDQLVAKYSKSGGVAIDMEKNDAALAAEAEARKKGEADE